METLKCPHCGETKPDEEFYHQPRNSGRRGRASWCKTCAREQQRDYKRRNPDKCKGDPEYQRAWNLNRKYGMTLQTFAEMLADQGGGCAICEALDPGRTGWVVDHDHTTGAVRAILCNNCNAAIGMLGDDHDVARAAYHYLAWHGFRQDMEADPEFIAGAPDDWTPGTGVAPDWFITEVLTG